MEKENTEEIKNIHKILFSVLNEISIINKKLNILKEEIDRLKYEEWKDTENPFSGPPPDTLW